VIKATHDVEKARRLIPAAFALSREIRDPRQLEPLAFEIFRLKILKVYREWRLIFVGIPQALFERFWGQFFFMKDISVPRMLAGCDVVPVHNTASIRSRLLHMIFKALSFDFDVLDDFMRIFAAPSPLISRLSVAAEQRHHEGQDE